MPTTVQTAVPPAPKPLPQVAPKPAPQPAPQPVSSIPGVQTTQINPADDLRSKQISVAPTANRMDIANTYLKNWNASTAPQFQADVNTAVSNKAATGQLGSGGLRTSLGDLSYNRDIQRNAQASNFYNSALEGSIGDAYKNVEQANQQQAYQTGAQNQAFNQNLATTQQSQSQYNDDFNHQLATTQQNNATQAQQFGQGVTSSQLAAALQQQQFSQGQSQASLTDQLTNSAFGRSLQQLLAGETGDPTNVLLGLSGQAQNSATTGMGNLSGMIQGNQAANTANNNNNLLQQLLAQYGFGGVGGGSPVAPGAAPIAPDPTRPSNGGDYA